VREAAGILGIEEVLKKKPRTLSGGQRQRVAMGRSIVREPQAFLMDEPLSNLDAKLRVQMRAEISRIQRDLGVTTIYVTHDQTEAMTMGDRVAVMNHGLLQQVERPQVLYDQPVNLFVAGFIGSPAMNLVEAEIVRADGGLAARFGDNALAIDDEVVVARPGLRRYEGRKLALGIRPEDTEAIAAAAARAGRPSSPASTAPRGPGRVARSSSLSSPAACTSSTSKTGAESTANPTTPASGTPEREYPEYGIVTRLSCRSMSCVRRIHLAPRSVLRVRGVRRQDAELGVKHSVRAADDRHRLRRSFFAGV
jgi:ABC-type sugar transport system ATPase subunit